jgi:hypothetical protein
MGRIVRLYWMKVAFMQNPDVRDDEGAGIVR